MELETLAKSMRKRGFAVFVCKDEEEVKSVVEREFFAAPVGTVGFGNSITLRALGLPALAARHAERVLAHDPANYSAEDDRAALHADVYFTSANAVSTDGQIVNIDGTGNRVAATCYGPAQVVYVIGQNKVAETLEGAMARAKQAAAVNAKRLGRKTPCAVTGKCEDCLSPQSICGVTTIHRKALLGNKIAVLLVQQDLGL